MNTSVKDNLFLFFNFHTWKENKMAIQQILNLIPTLQATALVSENVRVAKKKEVKSKDLIGLGVKNIVGIEFIKLESSLIAGL